MTRDTTHTTLHTGLQVEFAADVNGGASSFRKLESNVIFLREISQGDVWLGVMQFTCCMWLMAKLYLTDLKQVCTT